MSRHGQSGPPSGEARSGGALGPTRRARAALPMAMVGAGMATRAVSVRAPDVVFVKGLVEASDGLAAVFAERGGELVLAAPLGREAELDELLADLEVELGARVDGARGREDRSATEPRGGRWDKQRQDP